MNFINFNFIHYIGYSHWRNSKYGVYAVDGDWITSSNSKRCHYISTKTCNYYGMHISLQLYISYFSQVSHYMKCLKLFLYFGFKTNSFSRCLMIMGFLSVIIFHQEQQCYLNCHTCGTLFLVLVWLFL